MGLRRKIRAFEVILTGALAACGVALAGVPHAQAATRVAPVATLGIYTSAEDATGNYSTVPGQHPNIANYYLAWGQAFPTQFVRDAEAAGATPFIEIEPWHAGPDWTGTPSMVDIGNNAATDCGPSGTASCQAWLDAIGQDVAASGQNIIFTFAHEFNVSGQYPWSFGDSEGTTPAQWIQAWDTVRADINGSGGSPYTWWMWAPNVDTGGTTTAFAPWWPGAQNVDMVGVDGYPDSTFGLDTFQEVFGQSFTEMKALTSLPIFISETNLAMLGTGSYETLTQFLQDALADGATGVLEWETGGAPTLTSAQWSQLDAALGLPSGTGGTAPAATLGIYTSAEDATGNYSTVAGQHPNIANYYLAWGQAFPTQFIQDAEAAGATPFIEIEPWHAGPSWNLTPSMVDIGDNTTTDCGPSGTSSCQPWLDAIGQDVAASGHDIIFTFAHQFNVSGQYPWSHGDSEGTTPAQWIQAWDTVRADINGSGASPYASWMWNPYVDAGGTSTAFAPWWPGAQNVDMVGIDGYPDTTAGLDTFQQVFGQSFTEMKALTNLPIFLASTNLAAETGIGGTETVTQFVQDALADGASGLLEFEADGAPTLTSTQWSQLDAALGLT